MHAHQGSMETETGCSPPITCGQGRQAGIEAGYEVRRPHHCAPVPPVKCSEAAVPAERTKKEGGVCSRFRVHALERLCKLWHALMLGHARGQLLCVFDNSSDGSCLPLVPRYCMQACGHSLVSKSHNNHLCPPHLLMA